MTSDFIDESPKNHAAKLFSIYEMANQNRHTPQFHKNTRRFNTLIPSTRHFYRPIVKNPPLSHLSQKFTTFAPSIDLCVHYLFMEENDARYMRRALQLAALGEGRVSPNPMVGAVIVAHGKIIGEGYHRCFGEGHAEVNAVASVAGRELLRGATVYVTLEPCSHYGKTPPCSRLLIECGVRRVVVGVRDPFPKVSGRGIAMLREAGIEVTEGVLEQECRHINRRFITAHSLRRPWVLLKWAQSADGFIDALRDSRDTPAVKFSTPITAMWMHRERAKCDAVLVGSGTVLMDNPSLTVRHWTCRQQPLRVVLGSRGLDAASTRMLTDGLPAIVYADSGHISPHNLPAVLGNLYAQGITSLMVEGGAAVLSGFIGSGLWDEARVETSPVVLGGGKQAPILDMQPESVQWHGKNSIAMYQHYVK